MIYFQRPRINWGRIFVTDKYLRTIEDEWTGGVADTYVTWEMFEWNRAAIWVSRVLWLVIFLFLCSIIFGVMK